MPGRGVAEVVNMGVGHQQQIDGVLISIRAVSARAQRIFRDWVIFMVLSRSQANGGKIRS